jgi:hypothetical protein
MRKYFSDHKIETVSTPEPRLKRKIRYVNGEESARRVLVKDFSRNGMSGNVMNITRQLLIISLPLPQGGRPM